CSAWDSSLNTRLF
nr:immunoglobulin light chain junction region [Macaca mulatta]MPO03957.1 immunoglobulin light chain junction region [Macaca mulatta]MPO04994.1 immunoglobulin light chain junction region [Macaca mulatta]MPO05532.1 immunoglobulin light chain junction region [Macaca mulatta]MPO05940.1 immunoglobulin light chain junction region [Macaca mulatta]